MPKGAFCRFGVLLVFILALTSCAPRKDSSSKPLRCAFDTWLGYSAFYIAEELGYFRERGLNVEIQVINPLQEKNAAMARGDIDVMGGSIDSAIISSHSGVPGQLIFVFEKSLGNDALIASADIQRPTDLKGKRVGVEVGYVSHLFLLNFLSINNMTPADITIVPLTNHEATAAFLAGKIDGFATFEPFITKALKRPSSHVLLSSKGMKPLFCGTAYASRRAIEQRAEELHKLVAALQAANDFWRANPSEGNRIVARKWDLPIDEVQAIMVNTSLFTPADQQVFFGTRDGEGALLEYLAICANLWASSGEITKDIDVATLVNRDFVKPLY